MPSLGRFASAQAQPATDATLNAPGMTQIMRRQSVVIVPRRRPGWLAFQSYDAVDKAPPVTPPSIQRSAFQPTSLFHAQWIVPALEPWPGRRPRFSGMWQRAFVPQQSEPGGARQNVVPRFPFTLNAPRYRSSAPARNVKGSSA